MSDLQSSPTSGVRRTVASIVAGLLIGVLATAASAGGPPPTGTISCSVAAAASPTHATGIFFHPFINALPRSVGVSATNITSACDVSGVTGGKAPITGVAFKFLSRLPDGTCDGFTSAAPPLQKGKVKMRWQGLNPAGRLMTVAVTSALLASASYDLGSHTLTLITQPIAKGAFAGATATLHLGLDYAALFEGQCGDTGGFVAMPFGELNPATLDVQ